MKKLSLAAAAAVASVAFVVAPAHADQTFTGTITATDPVTVITEPDDVTEACTTPGGGTATTPVDTVNLTAQIAGNRRVVLTSPVIGTDGGVLYVYRNGTCVGADYIPDNTQEEAANTIDVDKVAFAAGDKITVKIALFSPSGGAWTLTVVQPEPVKGAASGAAVGNGARYASLPSAVSCSSHSAVVKFNRLTKRKAKSAVIKAGNTNLKRVRSFTNKRVLVRHIPSTARNLSVVLTLKNGKKVRVQRSYWGC